MKRLVVLTAMVLAVTLVLAISVLPTTGRPASAEEDLEAVYRRLIDEVYAGDLAAIAAFYTDDAVFDAGPCMPCVGPEEIQAGWATFVAFNWVITVISVEVSGNTVSARQEGRSASIRAAGLERVILLETVEFTGKLISSHQNRPDFEDEQTVAWLVFLAQREAPDTGSGPSPAGNSGFLWSLLLIAAAGLVLLTSGSLSLRLRQ